MIRVGTAGWSYPDWEGAVYPRHKPTGFHGLRYLADFMGCMEVNSTFYAQPRREHTARWCEHVAQHPDFRFVCKLHQSFTHAPEPEDPLEWEREAELYLRGIEPLSKKGLLSALLVQFPVSFIFQPGAVRRLGRIQALFGRHPLVLEVRHQSWFTPPALDTIRGLRYSLAHIDLPDAWNHPPEWHPPTGPTGYLRLHGRNSDQWFRREATRDERYDYLYSGGELAGLANQARRIENETNEAFVVTNNHFAGKAVANALDILFLLKDEPVPAPAEIVQSFPHLAERTRVSGQGGLF